MFQNPGVLKGVMQKVNPFKSTSQVTTALSACYNGDGGSVLDNGASTQLLFSRRSQKLHLRSHWNREGFRTLIRWVRPQNAAAVTGDGLFEFSVRICQCGVVVFQNPGMLKGVMQKVNPFKSASQVTTALSACYHGDGRPVSGDMTANHFKGQSIRKNGTKDSTVELTI